MALRLCDRCGKPIPDGSLRYTAKIQVFAAYDPLEITFEDLEKDPTEEIGKILQDCTTLSEEELMKDVYVSMEFDLCPDCQKGYVANPLPPANTP